jgi:hypothetical protein
LENDFSWLDGGYVADISADGQNVLFSETGVGGGPRLSTYLRSTDGAPAVRLGDGFAHAISPDGLRAIVTANSAPGVLEVIPTGVGQASRIERPGLRLLRGRWADARNVVALALAGSGPPGLYLLDVPGTETRRVTPEDLAVDYFDWAISPDGSAVAVLAAGGVGIFPVAGGESRTVAGSFAGRRLIGWIESGILVAEDRGAGRAVLRVEPTSGALSEWEILEPRDPAGIMLFMDGAFAATPNGRSYAYTWHRATSDLYSAEGWS